MNSHRAKVCRTLVLLVSVIGFVINVSEVSFEYFTFKITNRIEQDLFPRVRPLSLSICLRYIDSMDQKRLSKETGIKMGPVTNVESAYRETSKLTIEQIFKYSPAVNVTIASCTYRDRNSIPHDGNASVCNDVFKVTKYYTQEYVCYIFKQRNVKSLDSDSITKAMHNSYRIGEITATSDFDNVAYMTAALTASVPYVSRDYAEVTRCEPGLCKLSISGTFFMKHGLPPPFETRCVAKDFVEYFSCMQTCTVDLLVPHNRVPYALILDQPFPFKHISHMDMMNSTFAAVTIDIGKKCKAKCRFNPCLTQMIVTYTKIIKRIEKGAFQFSVLTPRTPDVVTIAVPVMSFGEFFSLVSGCFSTWFGLSFFSLSHIKIFKAKTHTKEQRTKNVINIVHLLPYRTARISIQ